MYPQRKFYDSTLKDHSLRKCLMFNFLSIRELCRTPSDSGSWLGSHFVTVVIGKLFKKYSLPVDVDT
jgi:hypothetical protein